MKYTPFGNTGINISRLGFGAMRLPQYEKDGKWYIDEDTSFACFEKAFELGVNYVDTAHMYCHENSQYFVGKVLKGRRDKVYLSTKLPLSQVGVDLSPEKGRGEYRRLLEEQLRRLDTDYIDFYHFHDLGRGRYESMVKPYNFLEEAVRAKEEGLIRHMSFSCHDTPEFMMELIDTGAFSSMLCQYNLLDRKNEGAIAYAKAHGVGTVIMGPVAGGRLAFPSEMFNNLLGNKVKSTPEMALRFVLSNPDVCVALSGMNSVEMVEENARVADIDEPLSQEEIKKVHDQLEETKKFADLYCTGCEYCMPCPKNINISKSFQLMNYHKLYGLTDYAKNEFAKFYNEDSKFAPPSDCVGCGLCEKQCPQNIKIRQQLKDVVAELR